MQQSACRRDWSDGLAARPSHRAYHTRCAPHPHPHPQTPTPPKRCSAISPMDWRRRGHCGPFRTVSDCVRVSVRVIGLCECVRVRKFVPLPHPPSYSWTVLLFPSCVPPSQIRPAFPHGRPARAERSPTLHRSLQPAKLRPLRGLLVGLRRRKRHVRVSPTVPPEDTSNGGRCYVLRLCRACFLANFGS